MATSAQAIANALIKNKFVKGQADFDRLGESEAMGYSGLGESQAADITGYATGYEDTLAKRRGDLAKSLSDYSSGMFEQQNPGILEDLNKRGLLTSPTAVAREQANALKSLNLDAQNKLMDFDIAGYGKLDEYGEQALGTKLGGQTQGLESAFEMGRSKLEGRLGEEKEARDAALATQLANIEAEANKKAAKMGMWGNIIGGGLSGAGMAVCFDPDTLIEMSDGSTRAAKDIALGDLTRGGVVSSVRKSVVPPGDRFNYEGVIVTGSHAVHEDGKWVRVRDSNKAKPIDGDGLVYSFITTDHRTYSNGITFADEWETDQGPKLNETESLAALNSSTEK